MNVTSLSTLTSSRLNKTVNSSTQSRILTVRTRAFKSQVRIKSCAEVGGSQVSLNTFSEYRKPHSNSGTFEASCDLTKVKRVRDSTQKTPPGLDVLEVTRRLLQWKYGKRLVVWATSTAAKGADTGQPPRDDHERTERVICAWMWPHSPVWTHFRACPKLQDLGRSLKQPSSLARRHGVLSRGPFRRTQSAGGRA